MTYSTLCPFLLAIVLGGCAKGDKVAGYIEVPSVALVTDGAQGSATSKITDAWVSIDEELIGVWELPARIPALKEGVHRVTVVPAIKRNGTFDDRLRYPFYASWSADVALNPEGTALLAPQTTYIPETEFWIEGFEDPFSRLITAAISDTTLLRFTPTTDPDLTFLDNSPCGGFRLDAGHRRIVVNTDEDFDVPGGPVFVELDYRSDVWLTVGALYRLDGAQAATPWVVVAPTLKENGSMPWNKIYIDLSPVFNTPITDRDVYIEAELPADRSSGQVYLDNFKLLRIGS